jgi:hypothetical protein
MSDAEEKFLKEDFARMSDEERKLRTADKVAELSTNKTSALRRLDNIEKLTTILAAIAKRWGGATYLLLGLGDTFAIRKNAPPNKGKDNA